MLNLCWFKHKKIFECFRCFWKVFCFYKNWKISKTVLPYFGDLVTGHLSRMPQSQAGGSVLVTCSRVEGPVAKGTQIFSRLSLRLLREWNFQSRKTLSKFFQNFWLKVFWRVKLTTYLSREKCVFCIVRAVLKTFSVFPQTFYDYSLSLTTESNPNTSSHSLQTPFLHHLNLKSSRKGMGSHFLT